MKYLLVQYEQKTVTKGFVTTTPYIFFFGNKILRWDLPRRLCWLVQAATSNRSGECARDDATRCCGSRGWLHSKYPAQTSQGLPQNRVWRAGNTPEATATPKKYSYDLSHLCRNSSVNIRMIVYKNLNKILIRAIHYRALVVIPAFGHFLFKRIIVVVVEAVISPITARQHQLNQSSYAVQPCR